MECVKVKVSHTMLFNIYRLLYSWLVPIGESNMVKLSGHEFKYISVLYSQLY